MEQLNSPIEDSADGQYSELQFMLIESLSGRCRFSSSTLDLSQKPRR